MRKLYKRLLAFFISLVFVMLSGAVGYVMARQEPRIVQAEQSPESVAAGANDARIASGAVVSWFYQYEMCRHTESVRDIADNSIVGLSFSQLQQKYPDARIVSFDTDSVVLEKKLICYCHLHYILKKNGDVLAVYRTKPGTDEVEKLREFKVSIDGIDEEEQKALITGRVFSDMQQIEHYVYKLLTSR